MKMIKRFGQFESSIGQRTVQSYNTLDNGTSALSVTLKSLGDLSDYRLTGQAKEEPELYCAVGDNVTGFVYDKNEEVKGRVSRILRGSWGYKVFIVPENGHEEIRIEPFDVTIHKANPRENPPQVDNSIISRPNDQYNNFYS